MTLFSTTQNHGGSRFRRFITLLALMLFSFLANESFAQELLCSDGIDNDGDGWIDCSDIDCAASIISVPVVQPTACPAANNGSITINVSGGASPVEYSINGGTTYAPTNTFGSLSPGVYNVRVRSGGATGCVSSYPSITLYSSCPIDVCQETGISTFQVTPVAGATSYNWTVDGGTVGIVGNGQGTVQIQVNLALLSLGVHNICATCSNACGATAPTCYTINVIACTPNAVDDTYTGNEDSPINGTTVGINDTDPNNNLNPTGFAIVTPPTVPGVSFVFNPNGTFTYTPTPNFNGPVTFTYQACDLSSPTPLCDTATVTLNINPVNDAPLAVNDSGITPEDTPIALNVPSNDTDSDGTINPATVTITTPPTNGTITAVSPTGGVTYTPNSGFTGTDIFFYRICDNGSPVLCDTAQVTVTVVPVNDPPVVITIPQVTPEDTPFGPVCFPITDEAVDNHTVVICGVTNGTATASVNNATDEVCINFAPALNYNGPASICLTICDNGSPILCTTVNVPINVTPVNDPPIATDDVFATPEDAPLSATVAPNDNTTDGPTAVFSLTPTDPILPAEGTIVFNVDGSFVFTPTANFTGPVTFTYQICDGAIPNLCDEAVATIIVGSLNDTPVVPVTPQITPEDTPFGPVCFPIIDELADNHTVLVCGVDNGTATASVNNLTDQVCINFTPTPNYNGPASICLTVCDNGNPILCTTVQVPITVVPANDPPVAVDDIFAGAEDAITTGSVAPNDNPTDGPSSIFSLTPTDAVTPAEGVLSFSPDGSFVFTPTTNFNGVVTFTYQICDGATPSLCDEAVATLIIGPVNDAPIAVDDTNTTNEDTPVSGDVTPGTPGQDSDPDGNPLTVSILDTPNNGSIVINPNGTYTYTPNPNFNGQDVFTYQVCDNGLPALCDEATVIITVTPVNDPPVAINDTYPGTEDVTVNGSVATNDDPTDGLSAIFTTTATDPVLATEGTLTLNPDGTFVFNPAPNFFGTVNFTYQICDGATPNLCDEAVVTIVIAPVNDVPVVPVTPQVTPEDTPISVCFPIIDETPDNHTVTVCGVTNGTTSATVNNATDQVCITFTPAANYNGPAEVCLTVCDNGNPVLCTTVIVPITVTPVNDAPIAVDDVVATPEDTPLSSTVAPNDNPTDGPTSIFSLTPTDVVNATTEGTLTFNPDGSFVFTPVANFNGPVTFTYQICDGATPALCDEGLVTIVVGSLNDVPVVPVTPQVTPEDTPISVCFPIIDEAVDNHTVTVCGVENGTTTATVNNATDQVCITFTPAANYNGPAEVCLTVCDNGNPVLCTTVIVPITVTPVNDPPVAVDDVVATPEDTPLSSTVAPNDNPTDGPTSVFSLTLTDVVNTTTEGTLTFNPDGSFVFTPVANFNGPVTFTYQICDGATPALCDEGLVTIVVGSLNDVPVVPVTPQVTPEDTPISVCFPIIDEAVDNHTVTVCGVENGTTTATVNNATDQVCITFTPAANYNGPAEVCLTVCDNGNPVLCTTVIVPITVTPVNDAPVAVDDIFAGSEDAPTTGDVSPNDNPTDGPTSIFSLTPTDVVNATTEGTLAFNPDGSFVFTPINNFNGTVTFTYQICDGATPNLCDEAVVTIVVNSVNDVPVVPVTPQVTPEDTPISVCFPIIDEAVDNHTVTVCGVENGTTTATVNNATDQVCITFTPAANYNGPAEVCLTVCDNGNPVLCTTVIVPITVTPVNDAPVAVDDIFAGSEDAPTTGDVSPNDNPTDGLTSIFSLTPTDVVNTTTEGTLAFNPDGSFVFTPINNFNGTVTFTYQICDGATPNLCDEAVVTIVVNSVNDVPVVPVTPQVTPEDTPISVCFPIIDEAVDNHTVTVCGVTNGTTTATVNNATDQVCITFTPAANYTGPAEVCLIVCDNGNPVLCTQVIVPITVTPVNDPPVAFDDTYAATEDVNLYGSVQDNDNPTDGPSAIFSLTPADPILPTEGTLVFSNNGDFVYTPAVNFNGTVTFTYQICDGATPNLCDEAVVTIVVASQNDVPVVPVTPQVTPEDTPISVCFPIIDEAVDNHTVTVCGVENGTTTATVNNATDQVCITFTPAANYNGPAEVCLTVCDNGNPVLCTTVIVPITVTPVNDAPIAVNDMFATPEDVAISSTVAPNDDDTDGSFAIFSLTPTDVVQPSEGTLNFNSDGTFVFTPANNFLGTVTFTYQICDGATPNLCDEAVVTIVVGSVNDVPVVPVVPQVTPEDVPITVCFPIIDDLGDDHTVTVCGVTNGTVAPAINNATDQVCLTFTPNPNYNGPAEVCLTVCDNGNPVLCTTVIVPITVLPVNDVPVAVDDIFPGSEDNPVTGTVAPNDNNNDGPNPAVFSTTPTDPVQPNEGVLTFNPDGTFIFTPAPDFFGTVTFTYQICDGATPALCDEAVVTIVVAPVNDAPVAFDDYNTTNEETPVSGDVTPGTSGQDFDPDNDPLTVTVINDPAHGTLTLNPNGTYTYVPDSTFNGQDIFTYQVCDNGSPQLCDIATVLITVLPANDPPIAVDDLFNGTEDNPVTGDVSPNDDETDGPYGTYTVTDPILPSEGTLNFNPDGTFLFTPAPDTFGTFDFSYQVCDGGTPEQCDTATVTIVIAPVNDAPIANDDTEVMLENDTLTSTVAPNDDPTDGPNAPCAVYSLVQDVQNGTLAFFPDGSYTYTPDQNFVGQDYFTYMMCDCANPAMCDVATVYITVNTICPGSLAITGFNPAAPAFCAGTSVDLTVNATSTAGFNNVGYVWNSPTGVELIGSTISANENGLYQVTVTDRNGCTATASVSVTENALPATPIVSNSGPYCEGTDASLFLTSGQTVGATYTWYSLPTNVVVGTSTAANGQLTVTGLTPGTYTYYAIATSGAGCTASSASTQVVIQAIPVNISDAGATIYACGSESVDLGATYPTMGTGWWSQSDTQEAFGVQIINPDDATTSVRNLVQGLNVFYWSLSNGVCIDFSVDSVYVYNDQTPIANPDQYTIASGDTLTFDVLLNDTTSTVHEYTVSVISQPTIGTLVYQGDGTFSYHFNSLEGGSDQFIYELCNANCPNQCDTALVTINRALGDDCWNTDLQNVMTPNNDGLNDELFFPCLETGLYPNNEIHIYNRWGDRVYSAQPYNNDWKGTFKDKDLPDGSYYYVLKLNDKNGKVITGYIVIQR